MALKELFIDGDVLDGAEMASWNVLCDDVYEEGRIAVVNAIKERWKINGHEAAICG